MIRMSEFVTGIFILAALAALIFVSAKSTQETFFSTGKVTWVADFDDVALLKPNAKVAASGTDVGKVTKMERFAKNGLLLVRVSMEIDAEFAEQCRERTKAKIGQESFLGGRYVDIEPDLLGQPLEKDPDVGEIVILTENFSDMFTMFAELKKEVSGPDGLLGQITALAAKLNNDVLSGENVDNIRIILSEMKGLLEEAKATVQATNDKLNGTDGLMDRATAAADSGANLLAKLDGDYAEIKDHVYTTLGKADTLLDSGNARINRIGDIIEEANPKFQGVLDTANNRLPGLIDKLEATLAEADTMMQGIDETVRNKDIGGLVYDARTTMQEMTMTLRALRADFSQLIWGGPGVAQPAVPDPKNDLKNIKSGKPERYGY